MTRDVHRYRLLPLTPIHIGDGNELDPTQYVIISRSGAPRLERFDPVTAVAALTDAERRGYIGSLRGGELSAAQRILQHAASRVETTPVAFLSASSATELAESIRNPDRRGGFKTMIRSGGTAIIPGSTVKGALRTGLLHLETERDPTLSDQVLSLIDAPGRSGRASDRLQELAFSRSPAETERDPMRDVAVADANLGEDATRIDQVVDWKRGRDGNFGRTDQQFQLHVERLFGLADWLEGQGVAPARIEIAVTTTQVSSRRSRVQRERERGRPAPERLPNLAMLLRGSNAHHIAVWRLERDRFFSGPSGRDTCALLDACLAALGVKDLDGLAAEEAPRHALIRLGWAGHFESKSIAAVRQGFRPQAKEQKTATVGSTRHGIVLNGVFVPFGWALLVPEQEAPEVLPRIAGPATASRSAPPAPATAASPRAPTGIGPLLFCRGDRVRNVAGETATVVSDVKHADRHMTIEIDGDLETVRVAEWTKI